MPQPGPSPLKAVHRPTCLSQAPAMFFFMAFETAVWPPANPLNFQTPQTRPQAYMPQPGPSPLKAVHKPTCLSQAPAMFFFTAFETAVWPPANPLNPSNPSNPSTGLHASARQPCFFYGVRDCRLAARQPLKPHKPLKPVHRPTCLSQAPAMFFYGVRDCRLAARKSLKPLKPLKPVHRPTCLSQAPAMVFLRRSRLPFGRPQTP